MKVSKMVEAVAQAIRAHPKAKPLNEAGQLVPDPTPMAPPVGFRRQPSMVEIVRRQIQLASEEAKREGKESLEEADDFDVGDDPELQSPYELDEESEVPISVLRARAEQAELDYLEAKRDAGLRMQRDAAVSGKSGVEGRSPLRKLAKPAGPLSPRSGLSEVPLKPPVRGAFCVFGANQAQCTSRSALC